jgi:predicted nucleic acid binding AN1-type Zn finger protein
MSQQCVYGYPCVINPNDFTPDPECSSPVEIDAHKTACANWGKSSYVPNKGCYTVYDDKGLYMHVARTSWGLGTNVLAQCDACGETENETIHCWDCGGDFCCASCWPKHDSEDC